MNVNRRNFLELAAGTGAMSLVQGCQSVGTVSGKSGATLEKLEKAAAAPVLQLDGADSPLIIESIELLRDRRNSYVRVRSKDGAEGVALTQKQLQAAGPGSVVLPGVD